ncbi:MAG: cryptochrome/photolyase family protein [Actinomycetes bacterium]
MTTSFFVLGDQLSADVEPWPTLGRDTVIVMIESEALISQPRHLTRVALYLSAMRNFAETLREKNFVVDYRCAANFTQGLAEHQAEFSPTRVMMNEPRGRHARLLFSQLGVTFLPDPFFLTDVESIRSQGKQPSTMEQFYRQQRKRLNVLMNGTEPFGGQWNYDAENRKPLPRDGGEWPEPWSAALTGDEVALVEALEPTHPGANALNLWPRTRAQAIDQLHDALERIIPRFGPHEDAASYENWHLAHSRLSPALNMGLLHPTEVVEEVSLRFSAGEIPLASAEGFLRQIIGWREWVYVLHHLRTPEYSQLNHFGVDNELPASWQQMGRHEMRCLDGVVRHLHDYSWNHHIERLMVLANAATLAGINPQALTRWMTGAYVDGAEWVMEANVIGMGTFADGGGTATKPYIAGGNYLNKMTNFCKGCAFSPTVRTGETACPLTTLYWDFLIRNEATLSRIHRVAPQRKAALARPDRAEISADAPRAIRIILGDTHVTLRSSPPKH